MKRNLFFEPIVALYIYIYKSYNYQQKGKIKNRTTLISKLVNVISMLFSLLFFQT